MKLLRHATLFVSTLLVVTLVEGAQHFVPPPGAVERLVASPAVVELPVAPPAVVAPAVVSPPSNTGMFGGDSAKKQAVLTGLLLALNSGYINGCCLSGGVTGGVTKQAVAAVTGAYTVSATQAAAGNFAAAAFQLKVLASFISGSAISGFLNPSPTTFAVASSMKTVFFLGSFLLFVASWAAGKDPDAKYFFYLAAIANGMQNSMTSTYTANLCRTTHYTGISSDIGTFIGQILGGNPANLEKLKVFAGLAAMFWSGGYISFFVTQQYAAKSLLASAFLYLGLGVYRSMTEAKPKLA